MGRAKPKGSGCWKGWQAESFAVVIPGEPSLKVGVLCCPVLWAYPELCQNECADQYFLPCIKHPLFFGLLCPLSSYLLAFELLGLFKLLL